MTVQVRAEHGMPLVLVADDDPAIRMLTGEVLEAEGMRVISVDNGLAAQEAFAEHKPDIVLLDVYMPGANGYRTCARLRHEDVGDEFPIIVMTAGDDEESVRRAFAAGATYFLTKPISWTLLPHRIRYFLRTADIARRLRESTRRADMLFETSAQGILIVDSESRRCMDANPALCHMLGYEHAEVLRLEWSDLQPGELYPANVEQLARCAAQDHGRLEGVLMQRKDGVLFHADITHNRIDIDGRHCIACFLMDVTEKRLADEALMYRASHDALTGLPNRALLLERLAQALKQAQRREARVALLFIDLDHFKEVNDEHGHAAGDQLLMEVARRLNGDLRAEDTVARLGGDEFVVLMPMLDADAADSASQAAARIITRLGEPVALDGGNARIGASIGVALYPDDADNAARLLESADDAMYRAKRAGRNRFLRVSRLSSPNADADADAGTAHGDSA
ncbi:GGDEF domain-containing response regulator [Methyloversatilis thermotolerans]|uniref:GGDEF domain-containing response regulator n=1 Tax=Methyloversatilis thermotolerans TaxID=1346290 RepID=UPI0003A79103|nr:diguanylate cyclase [Methyloversatilis thermotolerans]